MTWSGNNFMLVPKVQYSQPIKGSIAQCAQGIWLSTSQHHNHGFKWDQHQGPLTPLAKGCSGWHLFWSSRSHLWCPPRLHPWTVALQHSYELHLQAVPFKQGLPHSLCRWHTPVQANRHHRRCQPSTRRCKLSAFTDGLTPNYTKTQLLPITRSTSPLDMITISVNGHRISPCSSVKYLGVTISSNLSWSKHIDSVCKTTKTPSRLHQLPVQELSSQHPCFTLSSCHSSQTRVLLLSVGPASHLRHQLTWKCSKIYLQKRQQ